MQISFAALSRNNYVSINQYYLSNERELHLIYINLLTNESKFNWWTLKIARNIGQKLKIYIETKWMGIGYRSGTTWYGVAGIMAKQETGNIKWSPNANAYAIIAIWIYFAKIFWHCSLYYNYLIHVSYLYIKHSIDIIFNISFFVKSTNIYFCVTCNG